MTDRYTPEPQLVHIEDPKTREIVALNADEAKQDADTLAVVYGLSNWVDTPDKLAKETEQTLDELEAAMRNVLGHLPDYDFKIAILQEKNMEGWISPQDPWPTAGHRHVADALTMIENARDLLKIGYLPAASIAAGRAWKWWAKALAYIAPKTKVERLNQGPKPKGRRSTKKRDLALANDVMPLLAADDQLNRLDACTAAIDANTKLASEFRNVGETGILKALERGIELRRKLDPS